MRKKIKYKKLIVSKKPNVVVDVIEQGNGRPRVAFVNGLHGLEKSGALLFNKVSKKLPQNKGKVAFIPFANPTSSKQNTRLTPEDKEDLNRIFPGDPKGTISFKLAHKLFGYLKEFDLVVDIHNFPKMKMPIVGVFFNKGTQEQKEKNLSLIKTLDPDYIWKLDTSVDEKNKAGSLVEAIIAEGKLSFAVEAPDIELISDSQVDSFVEGMLNVVNSVFQDKYGDLSTGDIPTITRVPALSSIEGIFEPNVQLNDKVKKGDIVGTVTSLKNFEVQEIYATIGGPVVFILNRTIVDKGDRVTIIGDYTDV